jgi:hypothetical protein
MIRKTNEKDEKILNCIPTTCKTVADVGAGDCILAYYISKLNFDVTAFDIYRNKNLKDYDNSFKFIEKSIFDIEDKFDVVICSQVLEHLKEWEKAFSILLKISKYKLIITIPWKKSFFDPSHMNFWDDTKHNYFIDIEVFKRMSNLLNISINKFYTKPADRKTGQMDYLIEIIK